MGNCFGSAFTASIQTTGEAARTASTSKSCVSSGSNSSTPTATNSDSKFSSAGSSNGQYSSSSNTAEAIEPNGRILESANLRVYTFAELKSATKNFKPDSVLGEGGFGRVFKGWVDEKTLNPAKSGCGMVVAVKKLNQDSMQGWEEWQSEVNFLGRLSHPNLVRLLGYCWEDRELLLVYEFMSKGSLENHLLRKGVYQPLSWNLRLRILIDAARGIAFLHGSEKQIIYRDFKASNILLDSNYNAKISDFGLAKNGPAGGESHVTTRILGTYGYAAPEYMATGHLYVKSDVYGFGVVLLEMMTGQRALDTTRPGRHHNLVDWASPFLADRRKLVRIMDPRLEGQYPSKAAHQAAQLALACLATDPKKRPHMKEVAEILQRIDTSTARGDTTPASTTAAGDPNPNRRPGRRDHHRSPLNPHHGLPGRVER